MRIYFILFLLIYFLNTFCSHAQGCKTDSPTVSTITALKETIRKDARKNLMDLKKLIPGLLIEMPYATPNNFTKATLYENPIAILRSEPAYALKQIQEELRIKGLALKLFDAFRPFSVTCRMWRLVPDRRYAANPRNGSNHNRGVAVDLTIINLKTGKELDMGTPFDNFTDTAHHDFYNLPPEVIANRRLLKTVMIKYGFNIVPTEWWHYQWLHRAGYEIIDLDFADIRSILQ